MQKSSAVPAARSAAKQAPGTGPHRTGDQIDVPGVQKMKYQHEKDVLDLFEQDLD